MRLAGLLAVTSMLAAGADFTLKDRDKTVVISPGSATATAVVFISSVCPISVAYAERFNELYRTYSSRGVQFAFVNPNSNESADAIAEHSKKNQLAFPVYTDPDQKLADELRAQMTPEVFVFDRSGSLRYHGRVDDAVNNARVRAHDLKDQLDSLLAGQADPTVRETKAFGCTIKHGRG